MGARDRMAGGVAPLFLRLALGVTFVWAGAGKLFVDQHYDPAQSAALANMGVALPNTGAPAAPASPAAAPANPAASPTPTTPPTMQPPAAPLPPADAPPAKGPTRDGRPFDDLALIPPPAGEKDKGQERAKQPDAPPPAAQPAATPAAATPGAYTAADFPQGLTLRRVYGMALMIEKWSRPPEGAKTAIELWPPSLATGNRPIYFAFAAGITEFVAGAMVLFGFFGRLAALALAFVMLAAAWLTQIGPAVQAGNTIWMFIPAAPDGRWWEPAAYQTLLFQFSLMMAGVALFFTGPGAASLDAVLWGVPGSQSSRPRERGAAPAA